MKKLLILTGPQGSGNHLWSKVFSSNENVHGWTKLTQDYWVGHGQEPWSAFWEDPDLFDKYEFEDGLYFTSISCPYMPVGGPNMLIDKGYVPKYDHFIKKAKEAGFDVKLGIIGRDVNILKVQQARVRKKVTYKVFLDQIDTLMKYDPVFISTELLYLYRIDYLKQLEKQLDFSASKIDQRVLGDIISTNENSKYVREVNHHWLDEHMQRVTNSLGPDGIVNEPVVKVKDLA